MNKPTEKQLDYLKSLRYRVYKSSSQPMSLPETKEKAREEISELVTILEETQVNLPDEVYYQDDVHWDINNG